MNDLLKNPLLNKSEIAAQAYPHLKRGTAKARLSNQLNGREAFSVADKVAIYRVAANLIAELSAQLPEPPAD